MADWWANDPVASPDKSGPEAGGDWWSADPVAPSSLTASNVLKSAADIPVAGELARKLDAAISAALAPAVDPLLPDSYEKLSEPTFGERYAHKLRLVREDQGLQRLREEHPVVALGSNIAGTMAATGGLGATAAGARLLGLGARTLPGQLGLGAASGGLISGADATLRGEDPTHAALTGAGFGAGGAAGAAALGRLITPLRAAPEHAAQAAILTGEGVPLTAGSATGNRAVRWAESAARDVPLTGRRVATAAEQEAEGYTAAALRRAGIASNRATPDVIDNAFGRIGNDFEAVGSRNVMRADVPLGHELVAVEREYNNLVGPAVRAPVVQNMIEDVWRTVAANGGHLTGEQYNAMTSQIARLARGARNDPHLENALHGIRDALDETFARSLTRAGNLGDLGLLQQARRQYRNMLVLERAATGPGSDTAKGLISPSQLRNATVALQGRRAFARGQGDFADLARAGEAVLKPLPQSGTAPRAYVMGIPHTIGAVGLGMGEPISALAGLAGPALAGRALMSRPIQAWLRNQALPQGVGRRGELAARALATSGAHRSLYFPSGP